MNLFTRDSGSSVTSPSRRPAAVTSLPVTGSGTLPGPDMNEQPTQRKAPSSCNTLLTRVTNRRNLSNASSLSFNYGIIGWVTRVRLTALVYNRVTNALQRSRRKLYDFMCTPACHKTPLSLAVPLSGHACNRGVIHPFLFNLLPSDRRRHHTVTTRRSITSGGPITLLYRVNLSYTKTIRFYQTSRLSTTRNEISTCHPLAGSRVTRGLGTVHSSRERA